MDDLGKVKQDIEELQKEQKKLESDLWDVDTRTTVNEREIHRILEDIQSIKSNTTWILRVIVGAIVGAALTMLFGGM